MSEQKNKPTNPLFRLINEFLEYCEIGKNQSLRTTDNYKHYLSRFYNFCLGEGVEKPENITIETVRQYRLYLNRLENDKGEKILKLISQNYHLIALRAFLKYLAKQDVKSLAPEKIELPKNPQRQVEFLEQEELGRLLNATNRETDEMQRLRDNALLQTLFSTGLRVSELASLKKDSINLDRREFTIRGKGSKLRLVFLSDDAAEAIKKYLNKRSDNSQALFIGHSKIGVVKEKPAKKITEKSIKASQKRVEKEMASQSPSKDKQTRINGLTPRQIQRIIKNTAKLLG